MPNNEHLQYKIEQYLFKDNDAQCIREVLAVSLVPSYSFLYRVRVVSLALTIQFILTATMYSQVQRSTLGIVREIRSVKNPHGLFTGDFNGDGIADLGSYNENQILLQIQSTDSAMWHAVSIQLAEKNITKIIPINCTNDKITDLIIVDGKASSMRVYVGKYDYQFFSRAKIQFKDEVPEIAVSDINNDGKNDILIYGKRESGVTIYLGNVSGSFAKPMTLFPQKSFSFVTTADMNDDHVTDILAVDWLDNDLNIAMAYGKMKFAEPIVMKFENEPKFIEPTRINSDAVTDIVVSFAAQKELFVMKGNGSGEFNLSQSLKTHAVPDQLFTIDMNADGQQDIVYFNNELRGLSIWLNEEDGKFSHEEEFSGGVHPRDMVIISAPQPDIRGVAFVDSINSVVRVMENIRSLDVQEQETNYAVGLEPTTVLSFDMVGNDQTDLTVLNKESQAIALFMNLGMGELSGQLSIPIGIRGSTLQYALKEKNISYFIALSKADEQVSITEFNSETFQHKSYSVPVPLNSELLARYVDKSTKYLNFYLLSPEPENQRTSVVAYTQIAPTRFVQQTMISRFEPPLVGITMGDFNKDGSNEIAFLGKNVTKGWLELRAITRDETTKTMQPRLDFVLNMRDFPTALLWNSDLTGDGYPDLIINLQYPANQLLVSVNGNQQKFLQPKFQSMIPVNVTSRSQLKVLDVNGDHRQDIVLNNSLTKEIQVFWGSGNGNFQTVSRLISSAGATGFTFADLLNDGTQDLVVTDSLNGWLKIITLK